jgi:hypothetical protein
MLYELTVVVCVVAENKCSEYRYKHPYLTRPECEAALRQALAAWQHPEFRLEARCDLKP